MLCIALRLVMRFWGLSLHTSQSFNRSAFAEATADKGQRRGFSWANYGSVFAACSAPAVVEGWSFGEWKFCGQLFVTVNAQAGGFLGEHVAVFYFGAAGKYFAGFGWEDVAFVDATIVAR